MRAFCIIFAGLFFIQPVCGQDVLELLKTTPPNAFNPAALDNTRQALVWQLEGAEAEAKRLDEELDQLKDELRAREDQRAMLANKILGNLAFTSDSVREKLISQVLQTFLNAEIEIAAKQALVKNLSEQFDKYEPDASVMRPLEAQKRALVSQMKLIDEKLSTLKTAHENAIVSRDMVIDARLRLEEVAGKLAVVEAERQVKKDEGRAKLAERLASLRLDLLELRAREETATKQLAELGEASRNAEKLKHDQRRIDRLAQQIETRNERLDDLSMKIENFRGLLEHLIKLTEPDDEKSSE